MDLTNVQNKYIKSRANIIFCPSHLISQWVNEIESKCITKQKIKIIATIVHYKTMSLADYIFSDFIIVSMNIFNNNNFSQVLSIKNTFNNTMSHDITLAYFRNQIESSHQDLHGLPIHLFHYHRVIIDEFHEIVTRRNSNKLIKFFTQKLQSTYRWVLSGTPFSMGFDGYLTALRLTTSLKYEDSVFNLSTVNIDIMNRMTCHFRKNNKDCIRLPEINDIVKMLQLTSTEQGLYNSYILKYGIRYNGSLFKICCHPGLADVFKSIISTQNHKTLDEINVLMKDYYLQLLNTTNNEIVNLIDSLTEINSKSVAHGLSEEENEDKKQLTKHLERKRQEFTKHKTSYGYFANIIESIKEDQTCPICLCEMEDGMVLTSCGHLFCEPCINQIRQLNCPICRTPLKKELLYKCKPVVEKPIQEYTELNNLIQKSSTKIGNLLYFLNQNPDEKFILFSQWDELINLISDWLITMNIRFVSCKGSIYMRNHAINKFKSDKDIKIILLSTRNAAAGLNLTNTNNIIFLEPVYGNQKYKEEIESQAIGRCHRLGQTKNVNVYRYVVKDTVEEDIFLNKGTDNIHIYRTS
jgi:SNF2 family DNA or RNA helicase